MTSSQHILKTNENTITNVHLTNGTKKNISRLFKTAHVDSVEFLADILHDLQADQKEKIQETETEAVSLTAQKSILPIALAQQISSQR